MLCPIHIIVECLPAVDADGTPIPGKMGITASGVYLTPDGPRDITDKGVLTKVLSAAADITLRAVDLTAPVAPLVQPVTSLNGLPGNPRDN